MPRRRLILATLATALLTVTGLGVMPPAPALAQEATAARATVVEYAGEADLAARAAKGKTVVFFFASWCPNCRATVTELNARWGDVSPGLTLVIADYDKETALKKRFGVTYQDTFVLIDGSAKVVKAWNGGGVDGLNRNSAS